jgi:hypothetical protein
LGTRFFGQRGIDGELGESAIGAKPHLERVHGIGTGFAALGEEVGGRLLAEVEHNRSRPAVTGTALDCVAHTYLSPVAAPRICVRRNR